MNHSNMYTVGLALCTFANIASEEMSRDLANEIEKLLGSSNTYIRKKVFISFSFHYFRYYCLDVRPHFAHSVLLKKCQILSIIMLPKPRAYLPTGITAYF